MDEFNLEPNETLKTLKGISKNLNVLRVLRLFRILVKTQEFQRLFTCISRMCLACGDIMCLLLISMFFFVSLGQIIWGGKLGYSDAGAFNEKYKATADKETEAGEPWSYDASLRGYNFNDIFMGMFTMFTLFFNNSLPDLVNACNVAVSWPWPLSLLLEGVVGTGLVF